MSCWAGSGAADFARGFHEVVARLSLDAAAFVAGPPVPRMDIQHESFAYTSAWSYSSSSAAIIHLKLVKWKESRW